MTSVTDDHHREERLRAALAREGEAHEVDVAALYAATLARASAGGRPAEVPTGAGRRRAWRVAAAAVAVAAAAAVAVVVAPITSEDRSGEDPSSPSDGVEQEFSCPVQQRTDFPSDDDSFLPELSPEGRPAGEAAGAPRHEVVLRGDRATLRLGNADGTLASRSSFERSGGSYRLLTVTRCSNDPAAGSSSVPLVVEGLEPGADDLRAEDVSPTAVLVADRPTYDVSGLEKRTTAYADSCGARVCVTAGSRTGTRTVSTLPSAPVPMDLTSQLTDPDDVVGVESAQLLVALHDRAGEVSEVAWRDTSGASTAVPAVAGGPWQGSLYLVLVPAARFDALQVEGRGGRTDYAVGDLRG
ncbi:hypothetical protein [Nocardioides nanhaiensis]|uniref:Uncharacterized protein n=1 Tax=Nocardioides nanhaiensis TaxID=1476871 RepID=A0ABP8WDN2_9ACTN